MKSILSYIFGATAFISLLLVPGAVESEKYILAFFLIVATGAGAHLSINEDGKSTHDR